MHEKSLLWLPCVFFLSPFILPGNNGTVRNVALSRKCIYLRKQYVSPVLLFFVPLRPFFKRAILDAYEVMFCTDISQFVRALNAAEMESPTFIY